MYNKNPNQILMNCTVLDMISNTNKLVWTVPPPCSAASLTWRSEPVTVTLTYPTPFLSLLANAGRKAIMAIDTVIAAHFPGGWQVTVLPFFLTSYQVSESLVKTCMGCMEGVQQWGDD